MRRTIVIYVVTFLIFGLGIAAILRAGRQLSAPLKTPAGAVVNTAVPARPVDISISPSVFSGVKQNLQSPLSRLFLQLILIVLAGRLIGALFVKIGQPAVVGEMVAGILLGPSLFGWLCPGVFGFIFPPTGLGTLQLLSQIGVCLFMFVVGMELDVTHLRREAQTAILVSHVSILFPYLLGVAMAFFLFPTLAMPGATFAAFALFMGISVSITAFPVLARILEERKLSKTVLGTTALTCAAVGDLTAWCILAFIVAIVRAGGVASSLLTVLLALAFVALMLFVVKPGLPRWIGRESLESAVPGRGVLAAMLLLAFSCALCTEVIGIHSLFGAFLAGVAVPAQGQFRHTLRVRLEHFSSIFLLPLFFAFTGLRTQIGLLHDAQGWLLCLGIVLVATTGKLGGTLLTARFTEMSWNDSFALGALMNTRGLMELIALNLGYDLGILSPQIFAMLVIMALLTTLLTGPLLSFANWMKSQKSPAESRLALE